MSAIDFKTKYTIDFKEDLNIEQKEILRLLLQQLMLDEDMPRLEPDYKYQVNLPSGEKVKVKLSQSILKRRAFYKNEVRFEILADSRHLGAGALGYVLLTLGVIKLTKHGIEIRLYLEDSAKEKVDKVQCSNDIEMIKRERDFTRKMYGKVVCTVDEIGNLTNYHMVSPRVPGKSVSDLMQLKVVQAAETGEAEEILTYTEWLAFNLQLFKQGKRVHDHLEAVHCDISVGNVMYDANTGRVHIIDFGGAALLEDEETLAEAFFTPEFRAPEVNYGQCSTKSDIFSIIGVSGCLIKREFWGKRHQSEYKLEILNLENAPESEKDWEQCQLPGYDFTAIDDFFPKNVQGEMINFMKKNASKEPDERDDYETCIEFFSQKLAKEDPNALLVIAIYDAIQVIDDAIFERKHNGSTKKNDSKLKVLRSYKRCLASNATSIHKYGGDFGTNKKTVIDLFQAPQLKSALAKNQNKLVKIINGLTRILSYSLGLAGKNHDLRDYGFFKPKSVDIIDEARGNFHATLSEMPGSSK